MSAVVAIPPGLERELDERVFAPIGSSATGATVTPVPQAGGRWLTVHATRRGTPFWSVTTRVVQANGPGSLGAFAELRIWPAGRNRGWLSERLSLLSGEAPEVVERMSDAERLDALQTSLSEASFVGRVGTESDGRLVVDFLDARVDRVEPPPDLPVPAGVAMVEAPRDASEICRKALAPYDVITGRLGVEDLRRALESVDEVALDIETDCGPLGSGRDWEPSDGATRLIQLAWVDEHGETRTAVIDAYAVSPELIVRWLARPGLSVIAHNIRYEQRWLSFQFGLPRLARPFDTSCALRILDRHWASTTPGYTAGDAKLETAMRRFLGLPKQPYGVSWWGADELSADQLDYAALDAASLLPLASKLRGYAIELGCLLQIEAASLRQVSDATRRLPTPRAVVIAGAERLLDEAETSTELANAAAALRTLSLGVAGRHRLADRYRQRSSELT